MGTTNWDLFYISTHSLTRRLTVNHMLTAFNNQHFNSQPHKEADKRDGFVLHHEIISTHSLTRRLTAILDKNIFIQN